MQNAATTMKIIMTMMTRRSQPLFIWYFASPEFALFCTTFAPLTGSGPVPLFPFSPFRFTQTIHTHISTLANLGIRRKKFRLILRNASLRGSKASWIWAKLRFPVWANNMDYILDWRSIISILLADILISDHTTFQDLFLSFRWLQMGCGPKSYLMWFISSFQDHNL